MWCCHLVGMVPFLTLSCFKDSVTSQTNPYMLFLMKSYLSTHHFNLPHQSINSYFPFGRILKNLDHLNNLN